MWQRIQQVPCWTANSHTRRYRFFFFPCFHWGSCDNCSILPLRRKGRRISSGNVTSVSGSKGSARVAEHFTSPLVRARQSAPVLEHPRILTSALRASTCPSSKEYVYARSLWRTGARYIGEWSGNIKQGHGLFSFEDGSVYEGPFEADRMTDGQVRLCARAYCLSHRFLDPSRRALPSPPRADPARAPLLPVRQLRATSELYTYLDLGHLIPAAAVDTTCNAVRHVLVRHNTDLKQVNSYF